MTENISYAKPQQGKTKTLSCDFFKPFRNSENFERSFQNVKYKIDCITINRIVVSILPTLWLFLKGFDREFIKIVMKKNRIGKNKEGNAFTYLLQAIFYPCSWLSLNAKCDVCALVEITLSSLHYCTPYTRLVKACYTEIISCDVVI